MNTPIFTPDRKWNGESEYCDQYDLFKTNLTNLYITGQLLSRMELLRRKLFLFLYFKKYERISKLVYKKLYDECIVAFAVFSAKRSSSESDIDNCIQTEVIDVSKLLPNGHVSCMDSDSTTTVIINNVCGSTGPVEEVGQTAN